MTQNSNNSVLVVLIESECYGYKYKKLHILLLDDIINVSILIQMILK